MYLKIIALTIAIGALLKILSNRFEKFKRYSWWVGLLGAIATAVVCIIAFWQVEETPVTEQETQRIIRTESDSLREDIIARIDSTEQQDAIRLDSIEALMLRVLEQGKPDSTLQTLAREQAKGLEGIVETALGRGLVAIGLEKHVEALTHLSYALQASLENMQRRARAFFYMGIAHYQLGQDTIALSAFDSCTNYNPTMSLGWYNYGLTLDDLGRYEEAVVCYDSALAHKLDYHEAWGNRGVSLGRLDKHREAIASFDMELSFTPESHEAWYNRAVSLYSLNQYGKALSSCNKALEYAPGDSRATDLYLQIMMALDDW